MFGFKGRDQILKFGIWKIMSNLTADLRRLILVNAVKQSRRLEGKQIQDQVLQLKPFGEGLLVHWYHLL
jgi:hypothetical protein